MTISEAILVVGIYGVIIWAVYCYRVRIKSNEPPPLDYVQAKDIIDRLSDTQRKLDSIEDLLTTSQLCDEEYRQNVKCTWSSTSGAEDYTFTLDSTSNHFSEMAIEERERLRKDLLSDIDRLCELRRYGVTQSVTLTDEKTAGGVPGTRVGGGVRKHGRGEVR